MSRLPIRSIHLSVKLPTAKDVTEYIQQHPVVVGLLDWARTHSLPGFYKLPIHDVISFIIEELRKQDLVMRANSIAFSFFLSIFPSIIVLFTLVAYFPIFENFQETLYVQIQGIMPNRAGDALYDRIRDIATNQRGGLLSFSFVLAIIFSSNGLKAMMRGFEKSYRRTFKQRNFFEKQGVAIKLTFILGGLLIGSVALIVIGNLLIGPLLELIRADAFTSFGLNAVRWLAVLFLLYFGISAIYRYGAATRRKIRWFSPGATLATVLSLLASLGFSFYVDNFGRYHELYGPIGAIIVLLLWLQLNCFSLLVGFELNASIAVNRDMRNVVEETEEDD